MKRNAHRWESSQLQPRNPTQLPVCPCASLEIKMQNNILRSLCVRLNAPPKDAVALTEWEDVKGC